MQGTKSHCKFDFAYHVVFSPKFRKKILGGEKAVYLETCLKEIAQKAGFQYGALKIAEDNVQILVMIPPTVSVSKALQQIKGASAYLMLRKFPELRNVLPEGTFWAHGYYARTIGTLYEPAVKNFIKETNQLYA
jgi:putative transposase